MWQSVEGSHLFWPVLKGQLIEVWSFLQGSSRTDYISPLTLPQQPGYFPPPFTTLVKTTDFRCLPPRWSGRGLAALALQGAPNCEMAQQRGTSLIHQAPLPRET